LCPEERYNIEIGRLKKEVERLTILQKGGDAARGQMSALAAAAAAAGASANEVRQATAFTPAHLAELERLKRNVDQLNKDFDRQQKRCKFVMSMLEDQKEDLIRSREGDTDRDGEFASAFMTFCIYPRCFLSPEDSLFCAHFIKLLHNMRLPGFLTIELIDNIVNAATGSLYCMTEDEAGKHVHASFYILSFLSFSHL
jgi:THO complex subunit 2